MSPMGAAMGPVPGGTKCLLRELRELRERL